MKFPKFWAKATAEENDDQGQPAWFTKWAWSDISHADAQQAALDSARRTLRRFLQDEELSRYPYGSESAIREEVIERMTDAEGELVAAVTQNAYGALVVNTAQVMFVDIDFPFESWGDAWRGFLGRLLKRPPENFELKHETAIRERVKAFHNAHRHWGMRLYRTAAGMRVMVTHDLFDPSGSETLEILTELGSDPLYIRLCRSQDCFRARLTPKPWRCGHYAAQITWPHADEHQHKLHEQWQADYERQQAGFATCRLIETFGPREIHPAAIPILQLHDRFTRCEQDLPLA